MTPYSFHDYRKALTAMIMRRRQMEPRVTYASLAAKARVQPTYVSNVLKGRAHFSADQLYLLCRALKADGEQVEYLLLLLEKSRCQVAERREQLSARIEEIRERNLQTQRHLSVTPAAPTTLEEAQYYLDPFVQIVHVFLGVPKYAKDVRKIAEALGLPLERLDSTIATLERLGYVKQSPQGGYQRTVKNRHLPKASPLCLPHQLLLRLKSADQMNRLPEARRHHFSVTLSTTPSVLEEIRSEFLQFLKRAEAAVKGSPEEVVCQMNFDLFPWSL